ncbi:hypothetical protein FIBSPDRAFT_1043207 [Athelia psychrophila]|uniref:Uncharacterized protein n=1 Tax=Athelia psychrophila TaxID=1759441 RepID=A0A166LL94_9AGAM|nr:hypothetical protein FIBSPDRAFT_1043207 [Fibularhizoctonia sp. CBS 109695]
MRNFGHLPLKLATSWAPRAGGADTDKAALRPNEVSGRELYYTVSNLKTTPPLLLHLVPLLKPSSRHLHRTQMANPNPNLNLNPDSDPNPNPNPNPNPKPETDPKPEPEYELRTLAWVKLSCCMVAAVAVMIAGIVLSTSKNRVAGSATVHSVIPVLPPSEPRYASAMGAVFTVITMIITETIGSVHSTALRSTLVNERRLSLQHKTTPNTSPGTLPSTLPPSTLPPSTLPSTLLPSTPLPSNTQYHFEFNTNSRLFTAGKGWANGRLMTTLMALLLVISYAASALIVLKLQILGGLGLSNTENATGLAAPPIIVFGLSLFLQGAISLFGAKYCGPYWLENTDMLATTKKQIDYGIISHHPHRCMCDVRQSQNIPDPLVAVKPSARQPSASSASPTVKKAVNVAWGLILVYIIWGVIIYTLSVTVSTKTSKSGKIKTVGVGTEKLSDFSWAFLSNNNTQSFGVAFLTIHAFEEASLPRAAWPSILLVFMVIQGSLTLALNHCEAIINTTRDEVVWRQATGYWGVSTLEQGFIRTLVVGALGSWRSVFLLAAKFFCHWLFAQSFQVVGVFSQVNQFAGTHFIGITVIAHCAQVWYTSAVLVGFATITTLIANYKPHGPQPAAYGHFQTLADLIDEWYPVVYWGHKSGPDKDGVCHAGTHCKNLPKRKNKNRTAGTSDQPMPPANEALESVETVDSRAEMVRWAAVRDADAVDAVPGADAGGLFVAGVEHAVQKHVSVAR